MRKTIKQFSLVLLMFACILCLLSCGKKDEKSGTVVYVINKNNNTFKKIPYETKETDIYNKIRGVVDYLRDYSESDYTSPFPDKSSLLGWKINNNVVNIYFDSEYYNISVTDEALIRSAIVLTMCQFSEIEAVVFYVDDAELSIQGKNVGKMTADSFLDDIMMTEGKMKLTLYFPEGNSELLREVEREVAFNAAYTDEQLIVEELLKGPDDKQPDCVSGISSQTKLLNIVTKDMICYVNLSSEFLDFVDGVSDKQTVYSIVNSLASLPGINSVIITVNGDTLPYYGTIALGGPLSYNYDLVYTAENDLRR